jgi:methionyl-tRNA formyltransferase
MRRRRLRVVFAGTAGLLSTSVLRAVAAHHEVAAVVRPTDRSRPPWRRVTKRWAAAIGLVPGDRLSEMAAHARAEEWVAAPGDDAAWADRVRAAGADVICAAGFPRRVPAAALRAASHGGVNLHTSLLPRHRGPLPLFWVYHADDRDTGVTAHVMTDEFDAGDILGQRAFPLPRGMPVDALNARNADECARLIVDVMASLASGTFRGSPQDPARATRAQWVRPGDRMVDFAAWDVERVWHFLSGLVPRFVEPVCDETGRLVPYTQVLGFETRSPDWPAGVVRRDGARLALACRGGIVVLHDGKA